MHIALFSPAWPLGERANGIVTYVHHLRAPLVAQGHRVSVLTNVVGAGTEAGDAIRVDAGLAFRLRSRVARLRSSQSFWVVNWGQAIAQSLLELHRRDPVDVFEMEESFGWCADVRRRTGIPMVVKLHGPAFRCLLEDEARSPQGSARIEHEGQALAQMPVISAPSEATLWGAIDRYGLHPKVARVIPNPFPVGAGGRLWEPETADRKTILFVGRFDALKGGDIVVEALSRLLRDDLEIRLWFAGPDVGLKTPEGVVVGFQEFVAQKLPLQVRENAIHFGVVSPEKLVELRLRASVTVVASRWENQPNAVLEAMALACPVVAVDAGGIAELVEHDVNGLLARRDDLGDLCGNLSRAMQDAALARRLGREGLRTVAARHDPMHVASATLEAYGDAIRLARQGSAG